MKPSLLLALLLCIYLFNAYTLHVSAGSAVTVHYYDQSNPNSWDELNVDHTPALFGTEPLIKDTTGLLIVAGYRGQNSYDTEAALACKASNLTVENNPKWLAAVTNGQSVILIVDRGSCAFEDKVYNAQKTQAYVNGQYVSGRVVGVLVADDHAGSLDYMTDIGTGHTIKIPSALITQNHANLTKGFANSRSDTYAVLEFFLPINNTVHYTLFSGVLDVDKQAVANGTNFKVSMGDAARQLKSNAELTYVPSLISPSSTATYCATIPAIGKSIQFCLPDDNIQNFNGQKLVVESFRQFIISQLLLQMNASHMIYEYWKQFYPRCTKTKGDFSEICSGTALELSGLSKAPYFITPTKVSQEYDENGATTYATALVKLQNKYKPLKTSALYVNDVYYHGTVGNCQAPLSQAQCDYLQWICAGYLPDSTPKQCTTDFDCPFGQTRDLCSVCNGTNDCKSSSGVTMAVLFGIFFVAAIIFGTVVYLYVQKQQAHTKTEVDTLLRQYLPTDSGLGTALSNSDIKKTQQTRLIESEPSDV